MKLMIVATFLGLMASCAVERSDPSDPAEAPSGDQLPPASVSTTEQSSTVTPQSCPFPWEGPGNYYFCSDSGVWDHNLARCQAGCATFCELGARCSANCSCILN